MSVMSVSFGYGEVCKKSHEFLRRGCSYTPLVCKWAGDLLVTEEALLKQSEVNDMRGEAGEVQASYAPVNENCETTTVGIPEEYAVEETSIRTEGAKTFEYSVPKAENEEDEEETEEETPDDGNQAAAETELSPDSSDTEPQDRERRLPARLA